MKKLVIVLAVAVILPACERSETMPPVGTEVKVEKKDGVNVAGKLVEVRPEQVVVEAPDGRKTEVPKSQIASVTTAGGLVTSGPAKSDPAADARRDAQARAAAGAEGKAPAAPVPPAAPPAPTPKEDAVAAPAKVPEFRELTIPAGTMLPATLATAVASDTSHVEDSVRATLRSSVMAEGHQALPAGTTIIGHVTSAERSAKVKGRASIAFRFNAIDLPGDGGRQPISSETISHLAATTKKKDATKIGVGAGAGAVIGGIVGGGGGAAKGAAIGGGAGTAAVLATRGDEVRLAAGTPVSIKLTAPLTVRVMLK
ncbi:MAG: hypothetical protein ACJ731_13250 [Vicinamibacterales bacterium]